MAGEGGHTVDPGGRRDVQITAIRILIGLLIAMIALLILLNFYLLSSAL